MQIISRTDAFFTAVYALLIPLVGALVFVISRQAPVLMATPMVLFIYLWLELKKSWRRLRAARVPLPSAWREFLLAHSNYFRRLGAGAKNKFVRDIVLFLSEDNIRGLGGAPVDWQVRLLIAAGVAIMLHGRPEWEPPLRDGVTVYPGLSFDRDYRAGKGNIAGQAPERGPLLIAAESLKQGFAGAGDGHNVFIHELAHFFDLEARKSHSRYPGRSGRWPDASWEDILEREWRRYTRQGSVLPSYAAVNEAEFFAVACEMFFENPRPLQAEYPELYEVLSEFFNQDPRQVLATGPA